MEKFNKITGIIFSQLVWAGFIIAALAFVSWALKCFLLNANAIAALIGG